MLTSMFHQCYSMEMALLNTIVACTSSFQSQYMTSFFGYVYLLAHSCLCTLAQDRIKSFRLSRLGALNDDAVVGGESPTGDFEEEDVEDDEEEAVSKMEDEDFQMSESLTPPPRSLPSLSIPLESIPLDLRELHVSRQASHSSGQDAETPCAR